MATRTIFNGRLDFKNSRSFNKMKALFEQRIENHYKDDVLFRLDEVSEENGSAITIPKQVLETSEKSWNNTVQLLKFMSQYAISGRVQTWITQDGKVLVSKDIEPHGDKKAIINYQKGLDLHKEGKVNEAIEAFNKALASFDKHPLALEKRGYAHFLLHDLEAALEDFSQSINLYSGNPDAYLGRARVLIEINRPQEAISDLELAIKNSVPVQSVFWTARRLKAKAHLALKQYDKAEFELKFFVKRNFDTDETNAKRKRAALVQQAVLIQSKDPDKAQEHLQEALQDNKGSLTVEDAEISSLLERLQSHDALDIEQHISYL